MKHILVLFTFFSFGLLAQERESRPLPIFEDMPFAVLADSIKGWSFSLDGQWLSGNKKIPVRGVSRNTEFYESKENELGLDNFVKILAYEVHYGKEKLICWVKLYRQGAYKYPTRKRGWDEFTNAYYLIVRHDDLKKVKDLDNETVHVERIEAFDGGLLVDIKEKEILEEIKARVIIKPDYDRNMVLTLQFLRKEDKVRFQLCSLHDIFPDVEGVRKDFTRRGRTVYGSKVLFDYLYYEAKYYDFLPLLEITKQQPLFEDDF